eukprot:TRINITY_DN25672_c0_g1_i1.p2 TRINITY_DN25672_c0_g1~~TRINITY_DN25672_c0_g1_i1.p2  ORF type:complete len:109 (+),score=11.54 TRINITY_DN25672_c0_g1_i1:263-589(+)
MSDNQQQQNQQENSSGIQGSENGNKRSRRAIRSVQVRVNSVSPSKDQSPERMQLRSRRRQRYKTQLVNEEGENYEPISYAELEENDSAYSNDRNSDSYQGNQDRKSHV